MFFVNQTSPKNPQFDDLFFSESTRRNSRFDEVFEDVPEYQMCWVNDLPPPERAMAL